MPKKINIFDAIKNKDIYGIMAYVNAGGDVNVKNKQGATPLMYAIHEKWSAQEIKSLLNHIPNFDLAVEGPYASSYQKPINMAIWNYDNELTSVLLDYAGSITLGKEIDAGVIINSQNDRIKKNVELIIPYLNSENFTNLEVEFIFFINQRYYLPKSSYAQGLALIDSILSQPEFIPEEQQERLLQYRSDVSGSFYEYILNGGYIDENSIIKTMCRLAIDTNVDHHNKFYFFEIFSGKLNNKDPVIKFLEENESQIVEYSRYAKIIGVEYDEPGTIYISENTGIQHTLPKLASSAPGIAKINVEQFLSDKIGIPTEPKVTSPLDVDKPIYFSDVISETDLAVPNESGLKDIGNSYQSNSFFNDSFLSSCLHDGPDAF